MLFFTLVALPAVVCGVCWALVWLPSRTTGWLVRLDVGLAWFAALATLILVPTDVAAALTGHPAPSVATWWRATYWYGFAVQMLVLPLHMEFTRRGEFTVADRMAGAARYNLAYYAVLLCVGLAGILLLLAAGRLQPSNVVGVCIASSNAYGLVAAIFLLGFGLVAVPRALWNSADPRRQQRSICHKAGLQAERARAAHRRLSAAVATARRAAVLFAPRDPLRPLMDVVLALADSVGPGFQLDAAVRVPAEADLDIFDRADLAQLRRELKAALKDWEREHALYIEAVQEHLALEELVARLQAGPPHEAPAVDHLRWLWGCHLRFWAFRALATLAALGSLAIVVAEATIAWSFPNLSVVSAALRVTAGASRFLTELLCFLFLAYPCACAYYSLYRLGRFAFYRMVPRHTDSYSLCYSALLMCRFAAPLAFNFMAAIAMPETKQHASPDVTATVFYAQFGQLMMRQPLIGWQFTTFAPVLLVPYTLLLVSGVFNHVMALFKRGEALEFDDEWREDSCGAQGRRLLLLESDNAANGLPPGLTIEPSSAGAAAADSAGAAGPGDGSSSSPGLLSMLRSAAAVAAAEEAGQQRGGWWRRFVPGRLGGGGAGEGSEGRLAVEAARGRLRGLMAPPHPAHHSGSRAAAAGYSSLPSDAPASLPMRVAAPNWRQQQGAGGDSGAAGSRAASPTLPAGSVGAAGSMKAARAKFMAQAAGPAATAGSASHPGQQQQQQGGAGAASGRPSGRPAGT